MKVLVLHGYSAKNAGDGLLVREALDLVTAAFGSSADVTLLASDPSTFTDLGVACYATVPSVRGYRRDYIRVLKDIESYDLAVAVGGGYLRAGSPVEAVKMLLVHGPQLWATSRARIPTVYLPQSVGPARYGTRRVIQGMLRKQTRVLFRDDRSMAEFPQVEAGRAPDLATAPVPGKRRPGEAVDEVPVLSVRALEGKVTPALYELAERLGTYDMYVQSTTSGNDDRPASGTFSPRREIPRTELMAFGAGLPRVVVAVRLHAALMALAAGHYVVHLAYERKGFGAFDDLGLQDWVHPVRRFSVDAVGRQVHDLMTSASARRDYDHQIQEREQHVSASRARIVGLLQDAVRNNEVSRGHAG